MRKYSSSLITQRLLTLMIAAAFLLGPNFNTYASTEVIPRPQFSPYGEQLDASLEGTAIEGATSGPQVNAPTGVGEVWVDCDWAGTTPGTDPDGAGPATNFGTDSFATIQGGVDGVNDNGTVHVLPCTTPGYYVDPVDIDGRAGITIVGSNKTTVIVKPTTTLCFNVSTYGCGRRTIFRVVDSTDITLEKMTVDGDTVKGNNIFAGLYWDSTGVIDNNIFQNMSVSDASGGYYEMGVYLRAPGSSDSSRAEITVSSNSFINEGRVSLLIHDYVDATITGNTFYKTLDDFGYAIELGSAATGIIDGNTAYGFDTPALSDGSVSGGFYIENSFTGGLSGITKEVTLSNNEIYGNQYALVIGNEWDTYAGDVDIVATAYGNYIHDNLDGAITLADEDKEFGSSNSYTGHDNTIVSNGDAGYFIYTLGDGNITANITNEIINDHDYAIYMNDYVAVPPSASTYNVKANYNKLGNNTDGIQNDYSSATLSGTCNWWGAISGPTISSNPGGLGDTASSSVTYIPWLVYDDDASANRGFQLPTTFDLTAGADTSLADNSYRRIANAVGCVVDGQTVNLDGTFDFSQPNALASWIVGNDTVASTNDDYQVDVPPNADNVTLTATSLGDATIQGPGERNTADLEGFLQFYNNGTNQDWTISNLEIQDFEVSIGMYCCGGSPSNAYDGTTITNNYIRMAKDVKAASSSGPEVYQNIGIHLAYGQNQTISNNTIDIPGNGVSDPYTAGKDWWTYGGTPGWYYANNVALQSNTHGGDLYDGLEISSNTIQVLNAQSSNPARILGIWENGHAHSSNVTIQDNEFVNLAAGNDPAANRQMAFRVTSHSSLSTSVLYDSNTIEGANIGFGWLSTTGDLQPVQLIGNDLSDIKTGVYMMSSNKATIQENTLINTGSMAGTGTGIKVPLSAVATIGDLAGFNTIQGFSVGVEVDGSATVEGNHILENITGVLVLNGASATINCNNIEDNSGYGAQTSGGLWIDATHNWWGNIYGPTHASNPFGMGDRVSNLISFTPWASSPAPGGCGSTPLFYFFTPILRSP